jgi:hypothetical protein
MARRRILLLVVAALLTVSALLAIAILLAGRFGDTERRIIATTMLLAAYGLLSLPAVVLLDQGRARRLALGAVTLAGAGATLAVVSVWGDSGDDVGRSLGTVTVLALAAAQAAALSARRSELDPLAVRLLFLFSCGTAALAAVFASVLLWTQPDASIYVRLLGALVVLDLLLVALQPVLARAWKRSGATDDARGTTAASRADRAGCSPSRPAYSAGSRPGPVPRGARTARRSGSASGRR